MTDQFGRTIDYMRISLTERCNLRCCYCRPSGGEALEEPLSYSQLLRIAAQAAALGITKYKLTGGEPLLRPDCGTFIRALKAVPGVEQVTLTTNGLLLGGCVDALADAGLDGVNISLDTLDPARYRQLTGGAGDPAALVETAAACVERGLRTKVNAVLLDKASVLPLAALAQERALDVRFIELMPLGAGAALAGLAADEALSLLRERWPDLHPVAERRGNGPARYYATAGLRGRLGLIAAMSHSFCGSCNRVRLTCGGFLKPCLCYGAGVALRPLLAGPDEALRAALAQAVFSKPAAHCFTRPGEITEKRSMWRLGG